MPEGRDSIPLETQRIVRTRAGHRCSVDGETSGLEIAHIIEYSKSQSHASENLLLMCALCHTRSHVEKWDRKTLYYYRDHPFIHRDKGFSHCIQNLRYSTLGEDFVGREDILAAIHGSLSLGRATVIKGHVIHGMGGVGKTRAATEYAWRFKPQYRALLLLDADTPSTLSRSLASLCGEKILNLSESKASDQTMQELAALRWLQSNNDWLLIIDNADSDDSLLLIESLLPSLTCGHVIVTTRLANLTGSFAEFSLDTLSEESALAYLLQRTKSYQREPAGSNDSAIKLARLLDGLALALEQATAYMRKYRTSFDEYIAYWNKHTADAIKWHDEKRMHYPRSLAVTYDTSVDQLSDEAKSMLNILSWFSPDPIPFTILDHLPSEARNHLAELENLSLVKRRDDQRAFTIHRLIQEITRQKQVVEGVPEALVTCLHLFHQAWEFDPLDPSHWPLVEMLPPHAEYIGLLGLKFDMLQPAASILNNLGLFQMERADYKSAESTWTALTDFAEKHNHSPHELSKNLNNLATVQMELGKYQDAEEAYHRSLAAMSSDPSSEKLTHVMVLRHLAKLHFRMNRTIEAEAEFKEALEVLNSQEKEDKYTEGIILNDLGELLLKKSRLIEAERAIKHGIKLIEESGAEESQDGRLISGGLNNLAQVMQATGRATEAEAAYQRSLDISESIFGPNHPVVAGRLNNLAGILRILGRFDEALKLQKRALLIDEKIYGDSHVEVAMDLLNLGCILTEVDQLDQAEKTLRQALGIWKSIFGETHSEVAMCYNNLGCTLAKQEKNAEAEECYIRAKSIHETTLGLGHPSVAYDMGNLAELYSSTGRFKDADAMYKKLIEILVQDSQKNSRISDGLNNKIIAYCMLWKKMKRSDDSILRQINKLLRPVGHVESLKEVFDAASS